MKKGFTLVEMLVVIGIISILMAAGVGGYTKITAAAEKAKCRELVSNTATALTAYFQEHGSWPRALRTNGASDGILDQNAAVVIAEGMGLSTDENGKLSGYDRFGIVTPWAATVIKRRGNSASLSNVVPGGSGTIKDHIFHYALDLDGDGIIDSASVGGETIAIRATVAVWCCGKDGKLETYSRGRRSDDIHSWSYGQTQHVK